MRLPYLTSRLQGFGTTIFARMSQLAAEHDAVNLGQGFPDFEPPEPLKQAAIAAINAGRNQYAPGPGVPALRRAVAAHEQRFWGLGYDAETEITVSAGATEAICAAVQALCETGDEVVVFEPAYDSYRAAVAMAGAVARPVALRPSDGTFTYDPDELEAVVTPKTRLLLLNSPHNPTGKVFSREELEHIASVCTSRDLIAVADQVYEHMVFDAEHLPLAALPGMRERTVGVSSAAKTFSVTGWKIGWACAPPALTTALRTAKQFMTYTNGTPFQHAVAEALAFDDAYFTELRDGYRRRRDRLSAGLREAGLKVFRADGTYFVSASLEPIGVEDGIRFCLELPAKAKVAAIPCAAFYIDPRQGADLVRFAFCKTDDVLDAGVARIKELTEA